MIEILVVGSVALDDIDTPFGQARDALGGSAVYFSAAASAFASVGVVGVVGSDYPLDRLRALEGRNVNFDGLEVREGTSFRWAGKYDYDLNSRETLLTELGVFGEFQPTIPEPFRDTSLVFLGNIDPKLQLDVLNQVDDPKLVLIRPTSPALDERFLKADGAEITLEEAPPDRSHVCSIDVLERGTGVARVHLKTADDRFVEASAANAGIAAVEEAAELLLHFRRDGAVARVSGFT